MQKGYGHDEQMYLACPGKEVAQPDSLEDFNSLPASEFDAGMEASGSHKGASTLVPRIAVRVRSGHEQRPQTVFVGCCNDAPDKAWRALRRCRATGRSRSRGNTTTRGSGLVYGVARQGIGVGGRRDAGDVHVQPAGSAE